MGLVLLSGLDSKKYQAALRFKKHIAENQDLVPKVSISEEPPICNRAIDEFGELAVKHIELAQKRLSAEESDALIIGYQSGKTLTELGEQFGCHRVTVYKILKRRGIYESAIVNDVKYCT